MKFAVVFLFCLVFVCVVQADTDDDAWEHFKKNKAENVKNGPVEAERKKIFLKRRKNVADHNEKFKKGLVHFQMDPNARFADMPLEVLVKFRNGRLRRTAKQAAGIKKASVSLKAATTCGASLDWVALGKVTNVKDQGQCGSCYAFASMAVLESFRLINFPTLNKISLSPQQIVDCSGAYGNYGCNGGLETYTFNYLKTTGDETWVSYPYVARKQTCQHILSRSKVKVITFVHLSNVTPDQMKSLLCTYGPVSVGMDASHDSFQLYSGGIYEETQCKNGVYDLDHAVVVVGYGVDAATGIEYWKIKNSWGTSWGEEGYFRIPIANNMCGILTDVTYATEIRNFV